VTSRSSLPRSIMRGPFGETHDSAHERGAPKGASWRPIWRPIWRPSWRPIWRPLCVVSGCQGRCVERLLDRRLGWVSGDAVRGRNLGGPVDGHEDRVLGTSSASVGS
jgi:hypothetical protein